MDEQFAFPDDENGDVLRRMRTDGDDLSRPRTIDFEHQFSKKSDALLFLTEICGGETKVSISRAGQSDIWDVQVSMYMVSTHAAITEVETRLGNIARGFGGNPDGWGCFRPKTGGEGSQYRVVSRLNSDRREHERIYSQRQLLMRSREI